MKLGVNEENCDEWQMKIERGMMNGRYDEGQII